jgi:AFG3 family protein
MNYIIGAFASIVIYLYTGNQEEIEEITLNDFYKYLEAKQITTIEISKDRSSSFFNIYAKLYDNKTIKLTIVNNDQFAQALEAKQIELGIPYSQFIPTKYSTHAHEEDKDVFIHYLAVATLGFCLFKIYKNFGSYGGLKKMKTEFKQSKGDDDFMKPLKGMFNFNNSNIKEVGKEVKEKVKFVDVAGMEQPKKEVTEFVDFLKHPDKYIKLGAKMPRGALLSGPPGTGKTLLAKAVAGEADVPFFAMSGSDFVEMFVGVGASRVRELFKKAKEKSPSIIFIDEIDAVGRKRGGKFTGGNDERDNTLNQLLVEMDGFGTDSKVIIFAATNRPDILDSALMRPGRFDRRVEISLPERKDREEILKIYLSKVKYDTTKGIDEYAKRLSTLTPGFAGADLANLVNEAAILAARNGKEFVDSTSFEKASERVVAGHEITRLSDDERKIVAYHESGHAVVSWFRKHANPLVKVTIIPRSKGALGFTQYIPDNIKLHSREHLIDMICTLFGGRIVEEQLIGSITTGASDDLQKATQLAHALVTKYGMSNLGLRVIGNQDEEGIFASKPYSEKLEEVIVFINLAN